MSKKGQSLVLATAMDEESTTSLIALDGEVIGETSEVGLKIYKPDTHSYELYEKMGRLLGNANRRMQWVVGDWINLVEDVYPDRYSQATEVTGLNKQTLINRASICRRIPEKRRRQGLPFSMHADLAYIDPQEREHWLNEAHKNGWNRDELRDHRAAAKAAKEVGPVGETAVTSTASVAEKGELVPGPLHTCPNCGHEFA